MEEVQLTVQEFNSLLDYSCSVPTGVIPGKKWKRGEPYRNPTDWYLCEYVDLPQKPGYCEIVYRRIVFPTDQRIMSRIIETACG